MLGISSLLLHSLRFFIPRLSFRRSVRVRVGSFGVQCSSRGCLLVMVLVVDVSILSTTNNFTIITTILTTMTPSHHHRTSTTTITTTTTTFTITTPFLSSQHQH
ncbi:hypothetical protein E2C01_099255 [Portunus trituberculatus]|uniref:Uncharacterized protein n=1 Tax=Portunus trituberculatus TaxID=210409 RepID=A0A5B7K509_PORTR|nr:hypothetical protein [Portunus trituberculatus]